jgi:hypothetical protein
VWKTQPWTSYTEFTDVNGTVHNINPVLQVDLGGRYQEEEGNYTTYRPSSRNDFNWRYAENMVHRVQCCGSADYDPENEFCCDVHNSRPVPFLRGDTDLNNHINNFYIRGNATLQTTTAMSVANESAPNFDGDVYTDNFGPAPWSESSVDYTHYESGLTLALNRSRWTSETIETADYTARGIGSTGTGGFPAKKVAMTLAMSPTAGGPTISGPPEGTITLSKPFNGLRWDTCCGTGPQAHFNRAFQTCCNTKHGIPSPVSEFNDACCGTGDKAHFNHFKQICCFNDTYAGEGMGQPSPANPVYNETWYTGASLLTRSTNNNDAETLTDQNPGADGPLRYDFRTFNNIDTGADLSFGVR